MEPLFPRIEAMLQGIVEEKIRDATRDLVNERDNARLQRDALRAELESLRPKPATPIEVEGFRVGDLVIRPGDIDAIPVERVAPGQGGFWYVYVKGFPVGGWEPRSLKRPAVKVGDTVRARLIERGTVVLINPVDLRAMVAEPQGSVWSCAMRGIIPIAPLNP